MPSVNYSSHLKDMEMWVEALDQILDNVFHSGGEKSIGWENFKYFKYKDGSCKNNNKKILLSHCFFFSLWHFLKSSSAWNSQIMKQFKLYFAIVMITKMRVWTECFISVEFVKRSIYYDKFTPFMGLWK